MIAKHGHPVTFAGQTFGTYQYSKQIAFREIMRGKKDDPKAGVFVDVGGHVGLWSMWWHHWVKRIIAFEPLSDLHPLFHANLAATGAKPGDYELIGLALLETSGKADMIFDRDNTGHSRIAPDGQSTDISVPVSTLDREVLPRLNGDRVVAIKVDVEGLEHLVLKGGAELIDLHRPVICVEQKFSEDYGTHAKAAMKYLTKQHDYVKKLVLHGDYMFAPKD